MSMRAERNQKFLGRPGLHSPIMLTYWVGYTIGAVLGRKKQKPIKNRTRVIPDNRTPTPTPTSTNFDSAIPSHPPISLGTQREASAFHHEGVSWGGGSCLRHFRYSLRGNMYPVPGGRQTNTIQEMPGLGTISLHRDRNSRFMPGSHNTESLCGNSRTLAPKSSMRRCVCRVVSYVPNMRVLSNMKRAKNKIEPCIPPSQVASEENASRHVSRDRLLKSRVV